MASTSSAYGANEVMPFVETEKADTPLTICAATKKATEAMAHFKFTKGIVGGTAIDICNNGEM